MYSYVPVLSYVIVPNGVDFSELENALVWRDDASPDDEIATIVYRYHDVKVGEVRLTIAEGESSAYDFLKENTTLPAEIEKDELENPEAKPEPYQEKAPTNPLLVAILIVLSVLVILLIVLIVLKVKQNRRRKKRRSKYTWRSRRSSRF